MTQLARVLNNSKQQSRFHIFPLMTFYTWYKTWYFYDKCWTMPGHPCTRLFYCSCWFFKIKPLPAANFMMECQKKKWQALALGLCLRAINLKFTWSVMNLRNRQGNKSMPGECESSQNKTLSNHVSSCQKDAHLNLHRCIINI